VVLQLTLQEEEVVLQAIEKEEFRYAVNAYRGLERIKEVRRLIQRHFPEVRSFPPHETGGIIISTVSAEFLIGKVVVDLLK
jgi:hypothetical protein